MNTQTGDPIPNTIPVSNIAFHHSDHLNSASVDTDANGEVLEMIDYNLFGSARIEQTTNANYKNDYTYTGKELDDESGLYYYEARYYDAEIGRFTSVDRWFGDITDPQSLNKYAYVRNNPLKYVDPTGESFVDPNLLEELRKILPDDSSEEDQKAADISRQKFFNGANQAFHTADTISDFSVKGGVKWMGKQVTKRGAKSILKNFGHMLSTGKRQSFTRYAYGVRSQKDWKNLTDVQWSKVNKPDIGGIESEKLKNIIKDQYRPGAIVGNGSTADAVRFEKATGLSAGQTTHTTKAVDYLRGLNKLINSDKLSDKDRDIAEKMARDLSGALNSK